MKSRNGPLINYIRVPREGGWKNFYILLLVGQGGQTHSYIIFFKSIFYIRNRAVKWFRPITTYVLVRKIDLSVVYPQIPFIIYCGYRCVYSLHLMYVAHLLSHSYMRFTYLILIFSLIVSQGSYFIYLII